MGFTGGLVNAGIDDPLAGRPETDHRGDRRSRSVTIEQRADRSLTNATVAHDRYALDHLAYRPADSQRTQRDTHAA